MSHPASSRRSLHDSLALVRAVRGLGVGVLVVALVGLGIRVQDPSSFVIADDHPVTSDRTEALDQGVIAPMPPPTAAAPIPTAEEQALEQDVVVPLDDATTPDDLDEPAVDAPLVLQDATGSSTGASAAPTTAPASQQARSRVAPSTPTGSGQGNTAAARFASRFPAHAEATQRSDQPATMRWAVLIGVNEHQGRVRNNVGSRQDAEAMYTHLMDLGWRPENVLLLTDRLATRENVVEGLRWLGQKTNGDSVAIVWYSGHAQRWSGADIDGDGRANRIGIWPTDSRYVTDRELVRLLDGVRAGRLWLNIMACHAEQFLQDGLARNGRLVTVSARANEKSYEDPSVGHSVWGWNLVVLGMLDGRADSSGDGNVTVQEAVSYAIPRAAERTRTQRPHGPQNGMMVDRSGGAFSLAIPAPPEPDPEPEPEPSEEPTERERNCLIIICTGSAIRD